MPGKAAAVRSAAKGATSALAENDHWYYTVPLLLILWLIFAVGGILCIGIDVGTGSHGLDVIFTNVAGGLTRGTRAFQTQCFWLSMFFGCLPPMMLFMYVFRMGRHYKNRDHHNQGNELGYHQDAGSLGAEAMIFTFQILTHGIPFFTTIYSLATTAWGFVVWLNPDNSWGLTYATMIGIAAALVIFALGPTLIIVSGHFFSDMQFVWVRNAKKAELDEQAWSKHSP